MELPDYDDYNELAQKVDSLSSTLQKLISVLDIPKHYSVNNIKFTTANKAKKYAEELYKGMTTTYAGATGYLPYPTIETHVGKL